MANPATSRSAAQGRNGRANRNPNSQQSQPPDVFEGRVQIITYNVYQGIHVPVGTANVPITSNGRPVAAPNSEESVDPDPTQIEMFRGEDDLGWWFNPMVEDPSRHIIPVWRTALHAAELYQAIQSDNITLSFGPSVPKQKVPEHVLRKIPHFDDCLRNPRFQESSTREFQLPDESPEVVQALILLILRGEPITTPEMVGKVAMLADKWLCTQQRDDCVAAMWDMLAALRYRTPRDDFEYTCMTLYHHAREHKARYVVIHFLYLWEHYGRRNVSAIFARDLDMISDIARWQFVAERDRERREYGNWKATNELLLKMLDGEILGRTVGELTVNKSFAEISEEDEETEENNWIKAFLNV